MRTYLSVRFAATAWLALAAGAPLACAQTVDKLQLHSVRAEPASYRGIKAVHLTPAPAGTSDETLALVTGTEFQDGVIEAEISGAPAAGAMEAARGFVGIAFRVQPDAAKFEVIYLRPTNGRAEDQLRRNHSTQYVSFPDWPWQRLRQETPGLYESYADLEPGVWTKVRIVVNGVRARLFVHGAEQPTLIVNDLKLGTSKGAVALWVGPGTDAYFANLRVTPR